MLPPANEWTVRCLRECQHEHECDMLHLELGGGAGEAVRVQSHCTQFAANTVSGGQ